MNDGQRHHGITIPGGLCLSLAQLDRVHVTCRRAVLGLQVMTVCGIVQLTLPCLGIHVCFDVRMKIGCERPTESQLS